MQKQNIGILQEVEASYKILIKKGPERFHLMKYFKFNEILL